MFNNIGLKIKVAASFFAFLGILGSAFGGMTVMLFSKVGTPLQGILIIVIGCLGSWLSSLAFYGLGQLIENTDKLVELQKKQPVTKLEDIEANLPKI